MNGLRIPKLINSGENSKFLRRSFLLLLLLAIFLHFSLFLTLSYLNKNPFIFLFKSKPNLLNDDALNFVIVDEKLIDEEVVDEKPKTLGRVSRQSRDIEINPDFPKLGPSSSEESSVSAFSKGNPLPNSIASPELAPTPLPVPETPLQKAVKPITAQQPQPKPIEKQPAKEKVIPDLPELEVNENATDFFTVPKKPKEVKIDKKYDEIEVPGITKNDTISKITEEPIKLPEVKTKPMQQQARPVKKQTKPQRKISTRKIPVKKIGSRDSKTGGKLKKRLNSSAINTGSKSIAVLKSRYGEYMDKILRRIQQAIIIHQQINPIAMHEGSVYMSFTVNPSGFLDNVKFLGSNPQGITTEVSLARSVLQDVRNSGAFEPPTQEMLNDPDFQKIVINFVFENL